MTETIRPYGTEQKPRMEREGNAERERADVAERIVKAYDQAVLECADSQDTHVAGPGDVRTIAFRRDQALADRDALASRVTELEAAVTSNRSEIARMVTERDALAAQVDQLEGAAGNTSKAGLNCPRCYSAVRGHMYGGCQSSRGETPHEWHDPASTLPPADEGRIDYEAAIAEMDRQMDLFTAAIDANDHECRFDPIAIVDAAVKGKK